MAAALMADRFLRGASGGMVDLATARRVVVREVRHASQAEVVAWMGRCAGMWTGRDPRGGTLCDFGATGGGRHFEAWEVMASPGAGPGGRRAVRVPATPCGARGAPVTAEEIGDLVRRLEDIFDGGVSGRPRAPSLLIRGGPGQTVLVHAAARTARLHGYVPLSARLLGPNLEGAGAPRRWREAVAGRHVMVLDDGESEEEGRGASLLFLSLGLESARPHVLLRVEPGARVPRGAAQPAASAPPSAAVVREGATAYVVPRRRAGPGADPAADRSARAITGAIAVGRHAQAERLLRDRLGRLARRGEDAAGAEAGMALGRLLLVRGRVSGAAQAFDEARRRFERAPLPERAMHAAVFVGLAWTDAGRFTQAEAALRSVIVGTSRLALADLETLAHLSLARCLLWQGRVAEASDCLESTAAATYEIPSTPPGVMCARDGLDRVPVAGPADGLCRDNWAVGGLGLGTARACLASRVARAARDFETAGRRAAAARALAERSGDLVGLAAACAARAAVYGDLGDVEAVRNEVEIGLGAARRAHAPLRALRLRILMARGLLSAGRDAEAAQWLARLGRLDPAKLPRVVGLPLERVIRGDEPLRSPVPAGAGGAGRPDRIETPDRRGPQGARGEAAARTTAAVDALIEIFRVCQSSAGDAEVLARVAAILRQRARAAAVACFGQVHGDLVLLAADGRESGGVALARRAIESALLVAPSSIPSGLEAAVPVQAGGAPLGAFVIRFVADTPPDWGALADLVTAAAVAVAPSVRALVESRALPPAEAGTAAGGLLGASPAISALRQAIVRAAAAPFNVVVEGESGSGKELVARALHQLGPRRDRPLCALNCAALSDELVEAELFGHARGAFTGAIAERKGLFEEADHGVLVLDEVGELSARAQAKLLRAIQEGEVRRVGENFARPVDVRIVSAANRPLAAAAESGAFRRDLLYRLSVIRIDVPPLRDRREDIPLLAGHFWREAAASVGSRCTLSTATLSALGRYDWPGNVRELQNVMAALAVSAGRRGSIGPEHLPPLIGGQGAAAGGQTIFDARRAFETGLVRAALARAGGHRGRAAEELGLTRQGLAKLMARLGIQ